MRRTAWHVALLAAVLIAAPACGSGDDGGDDTPEQTYFGPAERETELRVPGDYDHATPTPLIVVLHGYGASGIVQLAFSRLGDVGALVLAPDGTVDGDGKQFWNATDACCDFFDTGVDDVAYIGGLIDDVRAVYNVDPKRIYLWGHSNGGFMSYRMACERAGDIAGIVSLAGMTFLDRGDCTPSEPVSILHVHGDEDSTIAYDGGTNCVGFDCEYPSVDVGLGHWADYDGCAQARTVEGDQLDLDNSVSGLDTTVERHDDCPTGVDVELWTIAGGGHIPTFTNGVGDLFWQWMQAHPKP